MKFTRVLLLLAAAALATTGSVAAQPARVQTAPAVTAQGAELATSAIEALRTRLREDVAVDNVGGITAAVVVGHRIIWAEGFGFADRDKKTPASPETLYRIGSISKSFTAVALAQLVERGQVRLLDPVSSVLPDVRNFSNPPVAPVSFLHLATHTAGLIREPRLNGAASGPIAQWEEKIIASIPTTSFDTLPGVRYSYSNIGYGVLGLAISRAAGVPFMELVERNIFRPLRMTNSTFIVPPEKMQLLSVGYANSRGGTIDAATPAREHSGRGYKVPNGGIYSNVLDLARFVGGITGSLGDTLLNAGTRKLVLTRHTPAGGAGYGLGFQLQTIRGVTIAGHGGSVSGYTAHLAFEPESRVGVILLRNYGSGRTGLASVANETILALLRR